MNSYFIGISGSWWIFIIIALVCLGLTLFSYSKTIPPVSNRRRLVLIGLRWLAMTLLLFALFEPIFTMLSSVKQSPRLALLFDNSRSMNTSDAGGDRISKYKTALANLDLKAISSEDLKYASFDEKTNQFAQFAFDSLKFDGNITDLASAIRSLNNYTEDDNIRAAVIFTDGAYNSGNNPVFDAENFGKPIFVVGIGDSSEPKDISVQSLIANEVAYVDNPIPINVNIKSAGYAGQSAVLSLFDNENKIGEQKINFVPDIDRYSAVLEFNPKQEGIRKISAKLNFMNSEITNKNNSLSEYVKVLKNKRNISIFAGAPNPDVSFIKNTIATEKGIEIKEFIQKQGSEFYNQPNQTDLNNSELIVFVGFPISSTPKNVIDWIKSELDKGKPLLFIASQYTDYNKLKALQEHLPFNVVSSKTQEFLAIPNINEESLSSPLLRVTGTEEDLKLWNNLPPLFRTETFVKAKPEAQIVAAMKVNNVALKEPLILSREFQNQKSVAILGYGLYRWKLLGYAADISKGRKDSRDMFEALVNNSFKWLSIREQNKLVNIRTSKKAYNQGEKIEFIGDVYDASYTPVEDANVVIKLGGLNENRELTMTSLGNGRYYASIDGLAEGDYSFNAEAKTSSRSLGKDNGRFSVGEIALEFQNLKLNTPLLRAIAERSGAKFFNSDQTDKLINEILKHSSFKEKNVSKKTEIIIWNLIWILALAVLLFSLEWFIRKRSGMI